jgi:hypothetical protein
MKHNLLLWQIIDLTLLIGKEKDQLVKSDHSTVMDLFTRHDHPLSNSGTSFDGLS